MKKIIYNGRELTGYLDSESFCVICGFKGVALHHWKSQGSIRNSKKADIQENLLPLCLEHHTELHFTSTKKILIKYPQIRTWLIKNGWEYSSFTKKWSHEKLKGY